MIRRPPRSTLSSSSAASDVYKRQVHPFQPSRGHAGQNRKDEDDGDEHEGSRPGLPMPVFVGRDRVGENLNGQRSDRLIEPRREKPVVERSEKKRRRLS